MEWRWWNRTFAALMVVALGSAAQARIIGRSSEISIGREVASQVEREYPVDRDPIAVGRVRQIGRRLAAVVPGQDFPFEFHVVETGEVNAFALPGGFVYVCRGLLQLAPNDDTLAFVLAHEISHVTQRHGIRQLEKNVALAAAFQGILAGVGGGISANSGASLLHTIIGLSFTRRDELEADEKGVELLTRAGYHPDAAPEAMRIVSRVSGADGKSIPKLLRSHPAPDSRIRRLTEQARAASALREQARTMLPVTPIPTPTLPEFQLAGLEGVSVAPCHWQPLVPGARWSYRTGTTPNAPAVEVRVLEEVAATPRGVFRLEVDLGRGVRATRLLAPLADRLLARPDVRNGTVPWKTEAVFGVGVSAGGFRVTGPERIVVPAGEFEALRVEQLGDDGTVTATAWYAQGIGLVRQESRGTGTLRELVSYQIPFPVQLKAASRETGTPAAPTP